MTNEEITRDIAEIKELLTYIVEYGMVKGAPAHIAQRVLEIADGWKEEEAE